MHGVTEDRLKRRLERTRRVAIERDIGNAELRCEIKLARLAGKCAVGAVKF